MLNTIYEEFDFPSKIKELKNKKIKIKRVIKGKEGEPDVHESIIIPKDKDPETKKILEDLARRKEKNTNPMFFSQNIEINRHNLHPQQAVQGTNIDPTSTEGKTNPKATGPQIIFEDPRTKEKSHNPMFMSYNDAMGSKASAGSKDLEEYILPKNITKVINEADANMKKMEAHIKEEKRKIDQDFDMMINEISTMINETRKKLHTKFDGFLDMYIKNHENMRSRVKEFKNKSLDIPMKNEVKISTYVKKTTTTLKSVSYFGKEANNYDSLIKFKEESCKIQANLESIDREVNKKLLSYLSEEINKQSLHTPLYNHSETSQLLLSEIKVNILNFLADNLTNFDHLVYMTTYPDFATFAAVPQISTVVSEDRESAIGDFKQLKTLNASLIQKFQTDHNEAILCIHAITDEILATGSKDGVIKIWNIQVNSQIASIKGHLGNVTCLKSIKALPSDLTSDKNVLKKLLTGKQEKPESFLLSGGGMPDNTLIVWDYNKKEAITKMKGHNDSLTTIISLKDGQTVITASLDCSIRIWDVSNSKELMILKQHGNAVTSLIMTKDHEKFISAGCDKKINVWKISYVFSIQAQRKVFEKCELEKTINDSCEIYCLNACHIFPHLIFSGGTDAKIKLWNIKTGICEREIVGHKSPVCDMLLFENPFEFELRKNYVLLSCGTNDEFLRISTPMSPINNGLLIDQRIVCEYGSVVSPLMQVIKDNADDSAQIAIVSQNSVEKYFLILKVR